MKIQLINPRFPLSLWDFSLSRDIDGSSFPFPPLSLATLGALTPPDHTVVISDENVRPANVLPDADIVGITGYSIQKEAVFAIADACRSRGKLVAIGGPLVQASNLDECGLHADAVFLGEAEYTWPAFLTDVQQKRIQPRYIQRELVDLADSPAPRFDLLDLSAYSSAVIETSRGCPHSCEFCEIPVRLGKGSRAKSTDQVMAEIRALAARGADSIFIIDDNFLGNRARALTLGRAIRDFARSAGHRISFSCQFTIDTARDEELLSLFQEANFNRVFIGIETPRESNLNTVRKRQNTKVDLLDAVRRIQSHNILVWGAFIVGFDHDDPAIFREQFDFIQAAAIPIAMVGILQALPGTVLYDRMKREGRLKENLAGGIRAGADALTSTNITPLHMSERELAQGYRELVLKLYGYRAFGGRLIRAVRIGTKAEAPGGGRLDRRTVKIILRLLRYYLLCLDPGRIRMFLRVVAAALISAPRRLETVLIHLIVYKHVKLFYERATAVVEKRNSSDRLFGMK